MILVWNGEAIEAIDMDKVFPGPRAEEVARLLEPGYLRGYLEGRKAVVGKKEIRENGRVGKGLRQIQRLINQPIAEPKMAAPWRYAMFLKEMILEKSPAASQPSGVVKPQPSGVAKDEPSEAAASQPSGTAAPQPIDTVTAMLDDVEMALRDVFGVATQSTGVESGEHGLIDGKLRGNAKRRRKAKHHPSSTQQPAQVVQHTGQEPPLSPKDGEEQPPNSKDEEQPLNHADEAKRRSRRRYKAERRAPVESPMLEEGEQPSPVDREQPSPRDEAQPMPKNEAQPSPRDEAQPAPVEEAQPTPKRKRRRRKAKRRALVESLMPRDGKQPPAGRDPFGVRRIDRAKDDGAGKTTPVNGRKDSTWIKS